jgi:thiol:disulfide interchange protein DsbD
MLFTPCVFPMIPVTISFFLKQSEKEHESALLLALVYSGTIVCMLTLAVLLLGSIILSLANNPWLNLGFGALLMFFALSLFGMYEIELPSFLSNFTVSRQVKGGLIGAVFMALTFTITSFTCTGPFLGVVLTPVAATQLGWGTLLLLSLVYSITFASPFFFLALFPGLLKALPKSGTWLNSVKVVMGFIEVAAAFKFLSIADAALYPGNPRWFTYDTVLCAWIALSVVCGLYLLGIFRLPHDTPIEHIGVMRLLLATFFLGLTVLMAPNLWHAESAGTGVVGEFLSSMLPAPSQATPQKGNGASPNGRPESEPYWYPDYEKAWKQAVASDKLLFIDFTGVNCQNCRYNEKNVFSRPEVRKELTNYVCVQIYNDIIPQPGLSAAESKRLAARNLELQNQTFGDVSTPLYVVFRPDRKTPEADGKFQGVALSRFAGKIDDVSAFIDQVLKAPLTQARAEAR